MLQTDVEKIKTKTKKQRFSYIPLRYIFAAILLVVETSIIIGTFGLACFYLPYFFILAIILQFGCTLKIISSDYNPDYKVPWLIVIFVLPIIGFMLYLIFYSRRLKKKYINRLAFFDKHGYKYSDDKLQEGFLQENEVLQNQAKYLCNTANTKVFSNTKQVYFPTGQQMHLSMLEDLKKAEKFIYLEYFIIKYGKFWSSILNILIEKAKQGVEVKVLFDDIGCMRTLPGNYCSILKKVGIEASTFSRVKGHATSEFNNRNHRKLMIIDGKVCYTGGVNLSDEYINEIVRFGYWKDTGIRLEGPAVWEFTKMFVTDYGINQKRVHKLRQDLYPQFDDFKEDGYIVPFGDGPAPIYNRGVGKGIIQAMLAHATKTAYITTPYLIIDNDMCQSIEDAALRGVDVRIIVPHIPDKKIVFSISRSFYKRLMDAGVKIYEYALGFIHAKTYIIDGQVAMLGTINLDYRSLVHHFENGVWMYNCSCIKDIKADVDEVIGMSLEVTKDMIKMSPIKRFLRACIRVFAPLF